MDARLVDHTISRNDSAPVLRALLEVTERGLVKGTWGPSVCHLRTLCDVFRPSLFPSAERVSQIGTRYKLSGHLRLFTRIPRVARMAPPVARRDRGPAEAPHCCGGPRPNPHAFDKRYLDTTVHLRYSIQFKFESRYFSLRPDMYVHYHIHDDCDFVL